MLATCDEVKWNSFFHIWMAFKSQVKWSIKKKKKKKSILSTCFSYICRMVAIVIQFISQNAYYSNPIFTFHMLDTDIPITKPMSLEQMLTCSPLSNILKPQQKRLHQTHFAIPPPPHPHSSILGTITEEASPTHFPIPQTDFPIIEPMISPNRLPNSRTNDIPKPTSQFLH